VRFVASQDKYLNFIILAIIIFFTLIIYSGTFKNGFTNLNDNILITENTDIQNLSASGIAKIFTPLYNNSYRPLTVFAWSLVYSFFGLNPAAYHTLNLIFHLLNIILVYIFIFQLLDIQNSKFKIQNSAFVACLFALHPMNTEAVSWTSAFCDDLYSFFYLASLICYIKYIQNKTHGTNIRIEENKNSKFRIRNSKFYIFSLLFFILSLLSKSSAVTLPVILILLDFYSCRNVSIKTVIDKIPFFLLALDIGVIAIISENFIFSNVNINIIHYSILNEFFILTYSLLFYIVNLIAPLKLSVIHPPPEIMQGFLPVKYYLSPILIIGIIYLFRKFNKLININEKLLSKTNIFGVLFLLFTISVSLFAGMVRHYQVAERYTYLPYLGLFYIIAIFISQNFNLKGKKLKVLIIFFIILGFSVISYNRNKVWANGNSLFNDVIEKYPRAYIVYNYMGDAKFADGNYQEAILDYNKAIEINQYLEESYFKRGNAKRSIGDLHGALEDYDRAIDINPKKSQVFFSRGYLKYRFGDNRGAIYDYNRAIELNPQISQGYYNRGVAKNELGDREGACSDWKKANELGYKQAYDMIIKYCL
jgi:protein O-mannosyl-transferase